MHWSSSVCHCRFVKSARRYPVFQCPQPSDAFSYLHSSRIVYLKYPYLFSPGGLTVSKRIIPGAKYQILPCADRYGRFQRFFRKGRSAKRRRRQLIVYNPPQRIILRARSKKTTPSIIFWDIWPYSSSARSRLAIRSSKTLTALFSK